MGRVVPLSSAKTRGPGARSAGAGRPAARWGFSPSLARRTFFERDAEATEGTRHGRPTHHDAVLLPPLRAVLGQRRVRGAEHLGLERRHVGGTDARRAAEAWFRRERTGRLLLCPPA